MFVGCSLKSIALIVDAYNAGGHPWFYLILKPVEVETSTPTRWRSC